MTGAYDAEIARLYREGYNVKAIRAEVGISERSVCRALIRTGCRDVKRPAPVPEFDERMRDMLVDGASYADVAETFAVPVKWLRDTLPGYGWDGRISGMLAHALKNPEVRRLHHEIRRIALPSERESRAS